MQKWLNLIQDINILQASSKQLTVGQSEISNFEAKTGIILPDEYKNYYQVFGSGRFGDSVSIHYVSPYLVEVSKKFVELIKQEIKDYPSKNELRDRELINWLNSILIFGSDDRGNIAAWDLSSFDRSKNAYDIYWIRQEHFEDEIYKISSDFFEFVNDFCLGKQSFNFLPEYMRIEPCDSFTSYKAEPFDF